MACGGCQIETVELFQFLDAPQAGGIERTFSIEGMQNDAFQEIAQGEVVVIGKGSQNLQ